MSKAKTKVTLVFSNRETAIQSLLKALERFVRCDDSAEIVIEGAMDVKAAPKIRIVGRDESAD